MSFISFLITVPFTLLALSFAASNALDVSFSFFPFDKVYTAPLNVTALSFLAVGFFSGALFIWIHSQRTRFLYWKEKRRAARLEKELESFDDKKNKV